MCIVNWQEKKFVFYHGIILLLVLRLWHFYVNVATTTTTDIEQRSKEVIARPVLLSLACVLYNNTVHG